MTRLGIIARCDSGGLGNQTWEMVRALEPDAVLAVTAGDKARGRERIYPGALEMGLFGGVDELTEFARSVDVVLTVECSYVHTGLDLIREQGARSVLYVNPELYDPRREGNADLTLLPTTWERQRLGFDVLPQPVALDRFTDRARLRESATVFYHPSAPAMLDRNGTDLVLAAIPHVTSQVKIILRATPRPVKDKPGNVAIEWRPDYPDNYWEAYPDDADVLLLPRRYGGLCLPLLEAAALGMPALMTDLEPQRTLPHVWTVRTHVQSHASMKGGGFHVHGVDPRDLALRIDQMANMPLHVEETSREALIWAAENSWDNLLPAWQERLGL